MKPGSGRKVKVRVGRRLTPHKLQAEARSRKRARRLLVVSELGRPMAESCRLHAVVRRHRARRRAQAATLGRRCPANPLHAPIGCLPETIGELAGVVLDMPQIDKLVLKLGHPVPREAAFRCL
jgi:hypothetical protein